MTRKQRLSSRGVHTPAGLNQPAILLQQTMRDAGIPLSEREDFLKWTIDSLYSAFKEERMNRRLIIENEIRQLGIRLPNGTVKKEYEASFHLPTDKISGIELVGADQLGLVLAIDREGACTLSGKPLLTGDFSLRLRYHTVEGEPASELVIPIAFNPNPRDLWKNIRTDPNIPYPKPDCDSAYLQVAAGKDGIPKKDIVAASQRGRSHAQEGKARDDHFAFYHCDESDWYIIAVADGAGSAKFSRKGSEVACNAVVEYCRTRLLENPEFERSIIDYEADRENKDKRTELTRHIIEIVYKGAMRAHEEVKKTAAANTDSRLKDFATTLMFAVCKRYEFGWFIASFWVGDGAMCIFDAERHEIKLLGTPDEGEFSGQTRFLTMPEIFRDPEAVAKRLRMAIVPDFTALFLMTDGVSDPMFETDRNLNDYAKWEEFYNKLKNGFPDDEINGVDLSGDNEAAKDRLLGWLDFWSPGNHDDRTIAILY